jgi:hypothetical protein
MNESPTMKYNDTKMVFRSGRVEVVVVVLRFGCGAIVVVVLVVEVDVVDVVDVSINRNFTFFSSIPRTAESAGIPQAEHNTTAINVIINGPFFVITEVFMNAEVFMIAGGFMIAGAST